MFSTIITTVKTLLRRPSTWVWGAIFPVALSTMFMFMFANLSSDGTVDPVPVAVVADEAWDASTFKDVATSLAKEGDDQLLEIHECDDAADANRALKAGEVAGVYTVDDVGAPKLTLLSSYDNSRASSVLTDRSILETVASSYTQNAELISQIAQDNPAALADPEAVARALSLEGGTRRVSLTRTTPDGTVIYYYALFGLVAMMSAEFAALSVVDLQPNLSGLGARRCVGGLSKTASLAGIFAGSRDCVWWAAPLPRLPPQAWDSLWARFPLRAARRPSPASSRALLPRAPCSLASTASRRWRLPTTSPAPARPSAGSIPSSLSATCSTACISLRTWDLLPFAPARWSLWRCCSLPPPR
ncbi:MAG: ABC transporter permease [Collinsella sp.]|nr:ABC transporter permease [Collinsella sp.]